MGESVRVSIPRTFRVASRMTPRRFPAGVSVESGCDRLLVGALEGCDDVRGDVLDAI